MEIKDWITIAVLIATIVSSHWLASKQTRKNKKAKWIEDFRNEISKFFSLSIDVKKGDVKTIQNLSTSSWVIIMLLDENNKSQQTLIEEISGFGLFMSERFHTGDDIAEYKSGVTKIYNLAKDIIRQEEKKL